MTGKFRVWAYGIMYYPEKWPSNDWYLDQEGRVCDYSMWSGDGVERVEDAIRMFFTGRTVKDAEGADVELYEGDIMRWRNELEVMLVCWDKEKSRFGSQIGGGYIFPLVGVDVEGWVLVGNKYENPELMKGVDNGTVAVQNRRKGYSCSV